MIRTKLTPLLLLALLTSSWAMSQNQYSALNIADSLKERANAVIRRSETHFRVLSASKAEERIHTVITVLNKQGGHLAALVVPYDKLTKVKSIKGTLYNQLGREIGKLKAKEIKDFSNFSSFSIFEDNRIKAAQLTATDYPYTVEWEYELEKENTMFYPQWYPQQFSALAVESARLEIKHPVHLPVRYYTKNLPAEPSSQSASDGEVVLSWKVGSLPAFTKDEWEYEALPAVITAPTEFEIEGYRGSMRNWQEFGQFMNQLNQDRSQLPPEKVDEIQQLVAQTDDLRQKVKLVYEHLQQNTRYVSIQLGIGGWQPFEASFVEEKKYGDCKALTNYTYALLQAAGIPSYYTLIRAGSNPHYLKPDFAASRFNHVILTVPTQKDTLFLECTSQTNPFGYLGPSTAGHQALLINPEGGHLITTRNYSTEENLVEITEQISVSESSPLPQVQIEATYMGLQYGEAGRLHSESREEQRKWLNEDFISGFRVADFSLSKEGEEVPRLKLEASGQLANRLVKSGNRLFITLGEMPFRVPSPNDKRKTPFSEYYPQSWTTQSQYSLPAGYRPEFIPEALKLESKFGTFSLEAVWKDEKLHLSHTLHLSQGRYLPEEYQEWVGFLQQVNQYLHAKVVLVKAT